MNITQHFAHLIDATPREAYAILCYMERTNRGNAEGFVAELASMGITDAHDLMDMYRYDHMNPFYHWENVYAWYTDGSNFDRYRLERTRGDYGYPAPYSQSAWQQHMSMMGWIDTARHEDEITLDLASEITALFESGWITRGTRPDGAVGWMPVGDDEYADMDTQPMPPVILFDHLFGTAGQEDEKEYHDQTTREFYERDEWYEEEVDELPEWIRILKQDMHKDKADHDGEFIRSDHTPTLFAWFGNIAAMEESGL